MRKSQKVASKNPPTHTLNTIFTNMCFVCHTSSRCGHKQIALIWICLMQSLGEISHSLYSNQLPYLSIGLTDLSMQRKLLQNKLHMSHTQSTIYMSSSVKSDICKSLLTVSALHVEDINLFERLNWPCMRQD